jgi:hypothetical protein
VGESWIAPALLVNVTQLERLVTSDVSVTKKRFLTLTPERRRRRSDARPDGIETSCVESVS